MSRFYADIQGNHGKATRQGTKTSGITGHIRGWDIGVRVEIYADLQGLDHVVVYRTAGSNGGFSDGNKPIADFTAGDQNHEG